MILFKRSAFVTVTRGRAVDTERTARDGLPPAGPDRLAAPAARRQGATAALPQGAGGATAARPRGEREVAQAARPRGRAGTEAAQTEGAPWTGRPSKAEQHLP